MFAKRPNSTKRRCNKHYTHYATDPYITINKHTVNPLLTYLNTIITCLYQPLLAETLFLPVFLKIPYNVFANRHQIAFAGDCTSKPAVTRHNTKRRLFTVSFSKKNNNHLKLRVIFYTAVVNRCRLRCYWYG